MDNGKNKMNEIIQLIEIVDLLKSKYNRRFTLENIIHFLAHFNIFQFRLSLLSQLYIAISEMEYPLY